MIQKRGNCIIIANRTTGYGGLSPLRFENPYLTFNKGKCLVKTSIDKKHAFLTYDSAQGGADFILRLQNKKIVVEAGAGKKDFRQIIETSKKVKANYSIIISKDALEFSEELNAVKIPSRLFLLI